MREPSLPVIASEARQSRNVKLDISGLPRFARNDGHKRQNMFLLRVKHAKNRSGNNRQ